MMFNMVDTFYEGKLSTFAIDTLSFSIKPFLGFLAFEVSLGHTNNVLIGNEQGAGNIQKVRFFMLQTTAPFTIASLI